MPNTIYEDPEYWPDTCPNHPDEDDLLLEDLAWTEEEEEEWNELDDSSD